ncbi:MAG: sugar transferase [Clostridiales bacterium]|nr:sugar transferase [Clostridiales bacterium]
MNSKGGARTKHLDFIILDLLSIQVAFVLAGFIFWSKIGSILDLYWIIDGAISILYLLVVLFNAPHSSIMRRGYLKELWSVIVTNIWMMLSLLAILFAFKESATYSRVFLGAFSIADVLVMFIFRCIWKKVLRMRFKKDNSKVLIIGYKDNLEEFINALKKDNIGYYLYRGVVLLDGDNEETFMDIPVAPLEGILDYVKEHVVNEVYILGRSNENESLADQFLDMGIMVHVVLNYEVLDLTNAQLEQIDRYAVLTASISRGTFGELFIKRVFDIFVSIIGLVFTGLFTLIFGPIIYLQSPGPIFFSQKRVGKNGKFFKMYKFRSMYMDAEERKKELMDQNQMNGLMFKMDNDPRIIPIGKFLRKTSIDEFPQFWNIFKGDMSLVGTRPPTLDEFEQYESHHLSRLAIKPGLTGMWQTSGRSDITDFEEIVRLDNEYIRNFSLGLDIKLIFKTFTAVLFGKGSK